MSPESGDIYRGNKASDFQPETRNPQSDVGGGLQPVQGNLQPVGSQTEGSQQFPSVQRLQVLGVENSSSVAQNPSVTNTNQAIPIGLLLALGVLIFIAASLAWLARPAGSSSSKVEPYETEPTEKIEKKTTKKKKKSRKQRKLKK